MPALRPAVPGLALLLAASLSAGCATHQATSQRHASSSASGGDAAAKADGSYTYHYYPSAEVYYAPDREVYFWHASAYWGVGKRLPSTYKLRASERVTLNLETRMPYREHHMVIARHPNPNPDSTFASAPTNER